MKGLVSIEASVTFQRSISRSFSSIFRGSSSSFVTSVSANGNDFGEIARVCVKSDRKFAGRVSFETNNSERLLWNARIEGRTGGSASLEDVSPADKRILVFIGLRIHRKYDVTYWSQ